MPSTQARTITVQSAVSNDLGSILISPNPLPCISLEGSPSQDTLGSLTTSVMQYPDLTRKAQLRIMTPALQAYVRDLQLKAQERKNAQDEAIEDLGQDKRRHSDNDITDPRSGTVVGIALIRK